MWKILLSLLIIALCFSIGRLRSAKVKRRVSCLKEMAEILKSLEADMRNERLALCGALRREAGRAVYFGGMLANCAENVSHAPGRVFKDVWEAELERELKENPALEGLCGEDIALIRKTGGELVHASMETQDAHFSMLHKAYADLIDTAGAAAGKKAKLYQSVGLMAGFFTVILLL